MLGNKTGLLRQVLIAFDKNRKGTAVINIPIYMFFRW